MRNNLILVGFSFVLVAGCTASPGNSGTVFSHRVSEIPRSSKPAYSAEDAHKVDEALRKGNITELTALLHKNSALLECETDMQQTPLHLAAAFGTPDEVKLLLSMGANVNTRAYNAFTPMHVTKNGKTAELLIRAGADLNAIDAWGNTPLQQAANYEYTAVVDAILASGYKMDLRTAIHLKKRDVVKEILKLDPSAVKTQSHVSGLWGGATPLALAAANDDLEIVQLLLEAGADVNEATFMPNAGGDATALTNAVWIGDPKLVQLLLSHGASTHTTGGKFYRTILDFAREQSSPEIVSMLEAVE